MLRENIICTRISKLINLRFKSDWLLQLMLNVFTNIFYNTFLTDFTLLCMIPQNNFVLHNMFAQFFLLNMLSKHLLFF